MSVTTLNPFDLLNGDAPAAANKKTVEQPAAAAAAATAKPASKTAAPAKQSAAPAKTANKPVADVNATLSLPTDGPKENTRRRGPRRDVPANERQARRATDRQSRSGFGKKADGEKKLTAGKGSWGKEGETPEMVEAEVSPAAAASVESVTEEADAVEEVVEDLPKRLTLAEYQAGLKKPAVPSAAPRRVASTLAAGEVVKKPAEVVYAPEIVKKPAAAEAAPKAANKSKAAEIDLTKYIAIKAVSSTEPRAERTDRDRKGPIRSNSRNNNTTRGGDRRSGRPASAAPAAAAAGPKVNLKDERSFPALGKN